VLDHLTVLVTRMDFQEPEKVSIVVRLYKKPGQHSTDSSCYQFTVSILTLRGSNSGLSPISIRSFIDYNKGVTIFSPFVFRIHAYRTASTIVSSTMVPPPCPRKKGRCNVCRECSHCKCACNGDLLPLKKRQRNDTAPTVEPRTSLTRSVKDSAEVVERRKIYIASLTEPDTIFAVENTLLPDIREIKTLKDGFDALQLKGAMSSLPKLELRELFTHEDDPKTRGRFSAMTKLLGEAIEKIAGFFAPNGAQALIRCTLHSIFELIQKSPMESLIQVLAKAAPVQMSSLGIEGRVARAIIVNSTTGSRCELATLDGKHKVTLGQKACESGAKDFAALAAGEPIPPKQKMGRKPRESGAQDSAASVVGEPISSKKNSLDQFKSENAKLEQQIAAYETQVVALATELESVKASLASAEKRASTAEGELQWLKSREESEPGLEGELTAAQEKEIEANLEKDLYEAV
jgi:hypothetical protein